MLLASSATSLSIEAGLLAGAAAGGLLTARAAAVEFSGFARSLPGTTWAVALVPAAAAVVAPGAPTGLVVVDAAMKATFAAVVALCAARSSRWSWLVASGVVALGAHSGWLGIVAFALLGVAAAATLGPRWGTTAGAAWGAALAQVLLRLSWPEPTGGTAALAGLAAAALGVGWYRRAWPERRRRARLVAGAIAGATGVLLALAATAAVTARHDLRRGVAATETGLAAARAGELGRAADDLAVASGALADANSRLGAWWARPVRLVPVAGRFVDDAVRATAAAADAAADAGAVARSGTADELAVRGGGVDVEALEALTGRLWAAAGSLATARDVLASPSSAPWIPGPVQERLDRLTTRVDDALADANNAVAAGWIAPGLLGADGARSWLLVVHTPVEQRGAGGVVGNYGELVADDGRVRLARFGRIRELNPPGAAAERTLTPDLAADLARYRTFGITRYFQNALQSPDFPVDARAMEQLSAESAGPDAEGVIAIDPYGLAAILQVTGPVSVPSWPDPIDATNARRVLLYEQYVALAGPAREDFLGDVARAVVEQLTTGELGSLAEVARAMAPAITGKHLMFHSAHAEEQAVIERLGAGGAMAPVDGGDFLQVVTQNTTETKIEWFWRRQVSYDVDYDPGSGEVAANLEVRLHNDAPPDGLPTYIIGGPRETGAYPPAGHNRTWLSIYSPLELQGATLDGRPLVLSRERELERNVYSAVLTVAPGGTAVVRLDLAGAIVAAPSYRLVVGAQPQVTPDRLAVDVQAAPGWVPHHHTTAIEEQAGDVTIDVDMARE